ncbi:nucleoside deaminase [Acuticoccus kandeliae]|uniref:nucleoside deaminase n=1 Tax=Acuticoccus kandeliae TaxID=2073160 RepID=UPI000D3EDE27|nr:nucleoside deaminase [Acuticoccus kandeliae]
MSTSPNPFMARAIEISRAAVASDDAAPFGAVVVKDGIIVGEGVNRVVSTSDPTSHGEVEAIRDACRKLGTWNLEGCELYTSCEPCELCVAAMYWARIERVYYAAHLSDAEALGFDCATLRTLVRADPDDRAVPYVPLMREEAVAVLDDWAKDPAASRF